MKEHAVAVLYVLLSVLFIYLGRHVGQIYENAWLFCSFTAIVRYREAMSAYFRRLPFASGIILYLASAIPFALVEENINCLPSGCKLIPMTIPFLLIELALLYFVMKRFAIRRFWLPLTIFCILGVLWEVTIGAASVKFRALPPFWFVYISFWVWMSYAYLTIVPLTLFLKRLTGGQNS